MYPHLIHILRFFLIWLLDRMATNLTETHRFGRGKGRGGRNQLIRSDRSITNVSKSCVGTSRTCASEAYTRRMFAYREARTWLNPS